MKKSDLKTGMIVETRNGQEYVVFLDICKPQYILKNYSEKCRSVLVNSKDREWINFDNYNEDMCLDDNNDSFDIMKVYIPNHPYSFMDTSHEKELRKLIWNREQTKSEKEFTMKELENHFGCKVKIVG